MVPYIGGKHKQSKWMSGFVPHGFTEYAEVFGGAMWFYIQSISTPKKAYYNDIDPLMVNLFTCFKDYNKFYDIIKDLPTYHNDTFQKQKRIIQENTNFSIKDIPNFEFAVAHLYVVVHIFSAFTKDIWRPNLNMVKRRDKSVTMSDNATVKRLRNPNIQKKLDKLQISNKSYLDFIIDLDHDNLFLYVDPPYWKTETHYRRGEFNKNDHIVLVNTLKNSHCKWMLSYYDFPELNEWFPENKYRWKRKKYVKASGNIKQGKKRNYGEEVLIMNYKDEKIIYFFI